MKRVLIVLTLALSNLFYAYSQDGISFLPKSFFTIDFNYSPTEGSDNDSVFYSKVVIHIIDSITPGSIKIVDNDLDILIDLGDSNQISEYSIIKKDRGISFLLKSNINLTNIPEMTLYNSVGKGFKIRFKDKAGNFYKKRQ